jgi:putative Mn2+ efflux pump MntP
MSLGGSSPRQVFRVAFHFGLFQAIMPILGWWSGLVAFQYIASWDHWVAFGLLSFVGGKAIYEAKWRMKEGPAKGDPTRGISLVVFSVATSVDALAVGLSLAALEVSIWVPALIIGLITAGLSTLGMLLGSRLGSRFGRRLEVLGGLILIGIGIKVLVSHL